MKKQPSFFPFLKTTKAGEPFVLFNAHLPTPSKELSIFIYDLYHFIQTPNHIFPQSQLILRSHQIMFGVFRAEILIPV
jgi:hypothetical protein